MRRGAASLALAAWALHGCAAPYQAQTGPDEPACQFYDSHAHLISPDLERYPRDPVTPPPLEPGSPIGPGRVGIPGGQHGPAPVNLKPSAEQMNGWMRDLGVCGLAAVQKGMLYRTDNRYIVDAANRHPETMGAVAIVDPQAPETPDLVRSLADQGIVAIRFFGLGVEDEAGWLSSPGALEVWQLADELGLIVDIEAPMRDSAQLLPVIAAMAHRFPRMPIVLDHLMMPDLHQPQFGMGDAYAQLALHPNISVKFTSLNLDVIREQGFDPAQVLRRAVDVFGADRVMWGSDIGTSSGTYREMTERALAATRLLSETERRKVLRDTGRRLFDPGLADTSR